MTEAAATEVSSKPGIRTFVFLDIETSHLPDYNYGKANITELSMWVLPKRDLLKSRNSKDRRILAKFSKFFDPAVIIDPHCSQITGLHNDMLEGINRFDANAGNSIISYLNHYAKPICLVAHNGFGFDFPIIKKSLHKVGLAFPDHIFCSDSLEVIRELDELEEERFVKTLQEEFDQLPDSPTGTSPVNGALKELIEPIEENQKDTISEVDNELFDSTNAKLLERQQLNEATPRKKSPLYIDRKTNIFNGVEEETRTAIIGKYSKARKELFPPRGVANGKISKTKKSFKLGDIYERLFDCKPLTAHTAECDVETLYRIALSYGDEFVNLAEEKAIPFADIKLKGFK